MTTRTTTADAGKMAKGRPFYRRLSFQLMAAIAAGAVLGHLSPAYGKAMQPLGFAFLKLVKMLIEPIIFCLVVHGIASVSSLKQVGRVGIKSLVYFEVLTTFALVFGIIGMNLIRPGVGMNIDISTIDTSALKALAGNARQMGGVTDYFLHIIPNTFAGAFAEGQILQVLFLALLFSFALHALGERGKPLLHVIDLAGQTFFGAMNYIMKVAPVGAFGAMAFTVGRYGFASLGSLAYLVLAYYIIAVLFVVICLGGVAWLTGFNVFKFIRFFKDESKRSGPLIPPVIGSGERTRCSRALFLNRFELSQGGHASPIGAS